MHIPTTILPFLAAAALHIHPTTAWSFKLIRFEAPHYAQSYAGVRVRTGYKRCTHVSTSIDRGIYGLSITQLPVTATPVPPTEWVVRYVGFWRNQVCGDLPEFIVHFYGDRGTGQQVVFRDVVGRLPAGYYGGKYWSWGEIPFGEERWGEVIPAGGVAVKKEMSVTGDGKAAEFWVVENAVEVRDLKGFIRVGGERIWMGDGEEGWEGARWEGFGGGGEEKTVVLSGDNLTVDRSQLDEIGMGGADDADDGDGDGADEGSDGADDMPPPTIIPGRDPAMDTQMQQNVDELRRKFEGMQEGEEMARQRNMEEELKMQQAMYNSLQAEQWQQNQAWANHITQANAAAGGAGPDYQRTAKYWTNSDPLKFFYPDRMADQQDTIQQLEWYWRQLGLPLELLTGLLGSLDPFAFQELLDDSAGGKLALNDIATYLWALYMQQVDQISQYIPEVAAMTPEEYGSLLMSNYFTNMAPYQEIAQYMTQLGALSQLPGFMAGGSTPQGWSAPSGRSDVPEGIQIEEETAVEDDFAGWPDVAVKIPAEYENAETKIEWPEVSVNIPAEDQFDGNEDPIEFEFHNARNDRGLMEEEDIMNLGGYTAPPPSPEE
ncbi:hypothetical protein H072_2227 [Dactylellina haptotyla CBS 200.50]|uniref:Uncharacterized protein n=1 Tax=Dactylellina haptotyla (strain CBS 200.50) TaxID=1284197 RepID=S8ALH6_DACHA|nr:hypothetical protein H072_2227 [Dactylellina haptotyla CBS 200.50]